MKSRFIVALLLGLIVVSFGLWPAAAQENQTLTVFAAASLTDAFTEIADTFKSENPNVEIIFNFGGSSSLATQLVEGGAPADIFASANTKQMQVVVDGERIAGKPVPFVRNRLVLIVPFENTANIESLRDLANERIKLVVAAPEVPVRDYTDAMLEKLAADPEYGEDYRDAVVSNIVSEEENVRQVAAKVALGEADAGIVYRSDVTPDISDLIEMLLIPDELNTLAEYPIAITNDSVNPELAQAFIDFLSSEAGQIILTKWNFLLPCPELDILQPEATAESTPEAEATPADVLTNCSSPEQ